MEIKKDLKKIALLVVALSLGCGLLGAVLGIFAYSQNYVPPVAPRWVSRVTRLLVDGNADLATVRCQGYTTQTAAILTVEQSDGTDVFTVDNSGNLVVSGTLQLGGYVSDEDSAVTFADNVLVDGAADVEQLVAQGYTTQTSFIFVVEQSDGTDVFNVNNDGDTLISGTLTISDAITFAGDLDMGNNVIENIGAAGTDFIAGGSLQTAQSITVSSGGISVTGASTFNDDVDMVGDLDVDGTTNLDAVDVDGDINFQGVITFTVSLADFGGICLDLDDAGTTSICADTDNQIDTEIAGSDEYSMTASAFYFNANELVLDADQDTSITADTDDRIDVSVGGSDLISITTNAISLSVPIWSTSYVSIEDASYFSGDLSDLAGDFTIADNLIVTGYVSIEDTLIVGGAVTLPYLAAAPANLVNGMIWMEADGLHVYYAGAEALVADGVP